MKKVDKIKAVDILEETFPDAECELYYQTPFQLLIATILSAQTTDVKVNQVTKELFKEYPDVHAFMSLSEADLGQKIKTIGLHKSKAKNIMKTCRMLIELYDGEVPNNREELVKLAGVGRKTANVVLSNAFNVPAMAVDTHVLRVSNRIGLVKSKTPDQTEAQLTKLLPPERWTKTHHLLIWHGRRICNARKPNCGECPLLDLCEYKDKQFSTP